MVLASKKGEGQALNVLGERLWVWVTFFWGQRSNPKTWTLPKASRIGLDLRTWSSMLVFSVSWPPGINPCQPTAMRLLADWRSWNALEVGKVPSDHPQPPKKKKETYQRHRAEMFLGTSCLHLLSSVHKYLFRSLRLASPTLARNDDGPLVSWPMRIKLRRHIRKGMTYIYLLYK